MQKGFVTAVVWTALASASGLSAQQAGQKMWDGNHSEMAAQHQEMLSLQEAAIKAATEAHRLAEASPLDKAAIQKQATTAQSNLQVIVKHLQDALEHAKAEDKAHIDAVAAHEQEALKHADELLAEAQKDAPQSAAVAAHAQGVLTHAQAASKVMAEAHKGEMQH